MQYNVRAPLGEQSTLSYTRRTRLLSQFARTEITLDLIPPARDLFQIEQSALAIVHLLGAVAPPLLSQTSDATKLANLRGRPRESFESPPPGLIDEKTRREEVFALAGSFHSSEEKNSAEISPEGQERFLVQLLSAFDTFRSSQQIVHSCTRTTSGLAEDIASRFALGNLGYLFPARITECRLGLEFYRSRFRGSMLSFAAGIETRFYIELSAQRAWISLSDEFAIAGAPWAPLDQNDPVGQTMERILESSLGFSGLFSRLREISSNTRGNIELREKVSR